MIFPKITALLAAYLGVFAMFLVLRIVKIRKSERIELEAGGNDALRRAVRSHGNLVETAPLFLIILGFYESAGSNVFIVLALAVFFAISRTIHPIGLSGKKGTFKMRSYGMTGTLIAYIFAAALLVYHTIFVM